jgi:hypothetical protein
MGGALFPEDEQTTKLRTAVEGAQAKSPDQAARVLRLQLRTGAPADFIERNVDEIERQAASSDFDAEKFRRDSPQLAAWLAQNPKHAEIARDDMANLSRLDRLLGSLQRGTYSLAQSGSALSLGANARALAEADALDKQLKPARRRARSPTPRTRPATAGCRPRSAPATGTAWARASRAA